MISLAFADQSWEGAGVWLPLLDMGANVRRQALKFCFESRR